MVKSAEIGGMRLRMASGARGHFRIWWPLAAMLAFAGCATGPKPEDVAVTAPRVSTEQTLAAAEADVDARRYQLAYQRLSRLDSAGRETPQAKFLSGEVLLGLGNAKEALGMFQAIQADPAYGARAYQGMGLSLVALNDFTTAKEPLDRAIAEDPNLWRAWLALGRVHDSKKDWQASEAAYKTALSVQPDSAVILNNMGMSLMLQHRYDDAAQDFQQALSADPTMEMARSNLRIALAWQGKYQEALVGLQGAGRADDLNNVGYVAMLRGDENAAQQYFAQALEISPTYHEDAARNLETLKLLAKSRAASLAGTPAETPPPAN